MITIKQALKTLNFHVNGTAVDETPGTTSFSNRMTALNNGQQAWGRATDAQWNELRDFHEIPIAEGRVFDMGNIRNVSTAKLDFVSVEYQEGDQTIQIRYRITANDYFNSSRESEPRICTFVANELLFAQDFKADDKAILSDATIKVPYYKDADLITDDTPLDTLIQCPVPDFVIYYGAAEIVAGEYTKPERAPEFLAKAEEALQEMKQRNNNFRKTYTGTWRPRIGRGIYR